MEQSNFDTDSYNYTFSLTLRLTTDGWYTLVDRVTNPLVVTQWHSSYQIKSELRSLVTHHGNARREVSLATDGVSVL